MKKILHFSADNHFFIKLCLYTCFTFLTSVPKILSWTKKKFNLKYQIRWEIFHKIVGKKYQNFALELENAVMSTVCNQGCPRLKYFPLQVPKDMKNYVFSISWFLFKPIFCKIKSHFGNFAENFNPKVQQNLAQISKQINKNKCRQKARKKFYRIKMQFWQQCRKTVVRNWTIFGS